MTIESGKYYGDGQKGDIRISPKIGLSTNIGNRSATEDGTSKQKETVYCFYPKPELYRHIPLKLQMHPFLDTDYFRERQNKLSSGKVTPFEKKEELLPDTEKVIERLSWMH